jgi:hypothetical protein
MSVIQGTQEISVSQAFTKWEARVNDVTSRGDAQEALEVTKQGLSFLASFEAIVERVFDLIILFASKWSDAQRAEMLLGAGVGGATYRVMAECLSVGVAKSDKDISIHDLHGEFLLAKEDGVNMANLPGIVLGRLADKRRKSDNPKATLSLREVRTVITTVAELARKAKANRPVKTNEQKALTSLRSAATALSTVSQLLVGVDLTPDMINIVHQLKNQLAELESKSK